MKKQIKILTLVAFAFGIGFGCANVAMSGVTSPAIAVVNVDKVLSSSAQVTALKKDQQKRANDLKAWLKNAQADVDKQSTPQTKQSMRAKYEKELASKREANNKVFSAKLAADSKERTAVVPTAITLWPFLWVLITASATSLVKCTNSLCMW